MQGELTRHDAVFNDGVVEERFEQRGGFRVGDVPANDPAAKKIINGELATTCALHPQ